MRDDFTAARLQTAVCQWLKTQLVAVKGGSLGRKTHDAMLNAFIFSNRLVRVSV